MPAPPRDDRQLRISLANIVAVHRLVSKVCSLAFLESQGLEGVFVVFAAVTAKP